MIVCVPHRNPRRGGGLVWLFTILAFLAGALGAYVLSDRIRALFEFDQTPTSPAVREVPDTPTALGRIEPKGGIINLAGPPGDRIAKIEVKPDQQVTKNQELVILASHELRVAELKQIELRQKDAEKQLEAAEAAADLKIQQARNLIPQLKKAQEFDEEVQNQKIALLQKQLKAAQSQLARLESVGTTVPTTQTQEARIKRDQLEGELEIARKALEQSREAARQKLENAQLQLEIAEKEKVEARSEVPSKEVMEANRNLVELQKEQSIIRAPTDGKVLTLFVEEGEAIANQPVLQMANLDQMMVKAEVYQTDIPQLREWFGQGGIKAVVTSPVLQRAGVEEGLTGRVTRIGSVVGKNQVLPLNPVEDADRRVVEVWVELDESDLAAKFINLQVTVKFMRE